MHETTSAGRGSTLEQRQRAARLIGFALIAEDPGLWGSVAAVLGLRLDPLDLAALAFAALRALEPDQRAAVYHAAQWADASAPEGAL